MSDNPMYPDSPENPQGTESENTERNQDPSQIPPENRSYEQAPPQWQSQVPPAGAGNYPPPSGGSYRGTYGNNYGDPYGNPYSRTYADGYDNYDGYPGRYPPVSDRGPGRTGGKHIRDTDLS